MKAIDQTVLSSQAIMFYQTKKFLSKSRFKVLADTMINVTEKLRFVFGRVEHVLRRGENAGWLLAFSLEKNGVKT